MVELEADEQSIEDRALHLAQMLREPDGLELAARGDGIAAGGLEVAEKGEGLGLWRDRGRTLEAGDRGGAATLERVDAGEADEGAEVGGTLGQRGFVAGPRGHRIAGQPCVLGRGILVEPELDRLPGQRGGPGRVPGGA